MMNTEGNNGNKPLGLWNVVSIGIGAMVGGGGSSRCWGQAALLMEASTWVAFAFGGIVAMFSGYAYARLGGELSQQWRHYRLLSSRIRQRRLFAGALVTVPVDAGGEHRHGRPCFWRLCRAVFCMKAAGRSTLFLLYALGIIAVMTLFNSLSNHAVGRLEVILVGIKMMILLLLIIAGVWSLQPAHISVSAPPPAPVRSSPVLG